MLFKLDVIKGREAPRTLNMEASSSDEASIQAAKLGWTILSCRPASFWQTLAVKSSGASKPAAWASNKAALSIFIEQLHALLQAGLSVIESLETLERSANPSWQPLFRNLIQRLKEGQTLSQSLNQTTVFPSLLIAMVQSAEVTSDLPQALTRFLEHEKRTAQVRHQITSVALYPALLFIVGGGVMVFLLLYVMPRFARVFENMSNLPWSAQAMVTWSHILAEHGFQLLTGTLLVAGLAIAFFAAPGNRAKFLGAALAYQPVAQKLRTYLLARWYRTIGMLVDGGIPLPEALSLANHVLPGALRVSGQQVEHGMRQGLSPAQAFIHARMTTAVAEQLLLAGERTGDVGLMLTRSAEFHELEVTKSLENAMRLIEPLVMTFIGIGVGAIVILMYLPIFELAAAIQ